MILKGLGVLEGGGLGDPVLLPELLDLFSFGGAKCTTRCHNHHTILRLLHAPNIIFDAICH